MGVVKGGSFLITTVEPAEVFTPEDFNEEHRLVAETVADFTRNVVVPRAEELEEQKPGLMADLLRRAAQLGLLSADIPEEYGGQALDKISSLLITENLVAGGSFAVAHGAHTGIGTLPIVFFGTEEQKARYLPLLASGARLAAYALTEPGAGSDALAARTRAVLSPDGKHYLLNGTKQFITNGGIADLFITYAKVDGERFTAFIVDRDSEGVSTGVEEKKMGIKGSSTCSLILENARVPVENVLGEVGRGHVVAFNILNIGRLKLAAGCVGSCKLALQVSARYAMEREQFGRPIARFGLIQEKLARMAAGTYAAESMLYRTGGLINKTLAGAGPGGRDVASAIAEWAIECSINKVFASEALDFAADEAVQIFGGYGYIQEYPVERIYRDSRINRIFEGTNEINRLLIPGTLLRRAMKGELPLLAAAQRVGREVMEASMPATMPEETPLGAEELMVETAKKIFLLVGGLAAQKYLQSLENEQEILGILADQAIAIFAMESSVARALKALRRGDPGLKVELARAFVHEAFPRVELLAREALGAMFAGDELRTYLAVLRRLARINPIDLISLRRKVAEAVLAAGAYQV